jgi:hypothetical protein
MATATPELATGRRSRNSTTQSHLIVETSRSMPYDWWIWN